MDCLTSHWRDFVVDAANPLTGNHADYNLCAPHVCCGWMDLHDDLGYGVTEDKPYFSLRALYWDAEATLVVTDETEKFVIIERTSAEIRFDATKLHGLVPHAVALELVARQDADGPLNQLFEQMVGTEAFKPKMIWDWSPVNPVYM